MSECEEVRALLDERGIEYEEIQTKNEGTTFLIDYCERCGDYLKRISVWSTYIEAERRYASPEQAVDVVVGPQITEDTSDGWHSFKDLYHHRALLFSVIVHNYKDMCWKSKRHHDGKELDWNFIVGIDTPWGQASYHYGMDYWDMFDCKVLKKAPYYDGYTADESVARIARLVNLDVTRDGDREDLLNECLRTFRLFLSHPDLLNKKTVRAAHDELARKMTDLGVQEPGMASPDRAIQTTSRAYEVLLMVNRCSKMELTDYILKLEESRDGYVEESRKNEQLKADNEKLRELVRDYDKCLDTALYLAGNAGYPRMPDSGLFSSLHPRMRELGIEVKE